MLGVIGGSGVYALPGLQDRRTEVVDTPYGAPSGPLSFGRLDDTSLVFLPRHGEGHRLAPHELNYRANVCALKRAGVTALVSISAVGSLREELRPGHVVVVDQYLDLTRRRPSTFFEDGLVAHVGMAEPVCPLLAVAAADAAERAGATVHRGGTYVCIEGPQFSSRAESQLYRTWGASVIGMSAMPEAKLAREAELPYATLAFVTDYDCWHTSAQAVSVDQILTLLRQSAQLSLRLVAELACQLPELSASPARSALNDALITAPEAIGPDVRARLAWLLDEQRLPPLRK